MADCGDDLVPPRRRRGPGAAPRRLHRRHGGDARALPGLARRPRPAGPVPSLALLRARDDRARARGAPTCRARSRSPTRAGGCSPSGRLASTTWSRTCTATPTRSATRCAPRRSPSWPGTGSSATSATAPTAAPSCSTGPTRARRRRAGTSTWYLALNRARLPESKEATIARYRERLEAHGVATADWWDRQLGLSLVGMAAVVRVGEGGRRPGRAGLVGAGGPGRGAWL